jgi:xanthine dehydrogenase accessory factor
VLATVVRTQPPASARPGDKAVIGADGRLRGWVGGSCAEPLIRREALRALAAGASRLVHIVPEGTPVPAPEKGELSFATTCPSGGGLDVFLEPRLPRPLLIVIGASPTAHALVRMGQVAGFRTCAVHPGASAAEFSDADLVLPTLDLAPAAPGPDSWAVVATMGHYDEDALEAALRYPNLDVALVASERRSQAVLAALRSRGIPEHELARVRSPAGQRAGGQAEIAVLALAEVVVRRAQRRPRAEPAGFATDPVCGMPVDLAAPHPIAAHDGRDYHFCSSGCRERFESDPARYAT